ncbi:MAG: Uncharacterised protein [Synechococcus sp. MIT S9220]|nr:MAG: Uncharacterised protein [Synechococcus sp. MIT S9220]
MAQSLQAFSLLLMLACLPFQFAALWIQPRQLCLHTQQLVFAEGFDALLKGLQSSRRILKAEIALLDRAGIALLLGAELFLSLLKASALSLSRFEGQHQLLPAALLELVLEFLISPGFGAVFFKPLSGRQQFLLNDAATLLALLHLIELAPGLFNAGVEQRHTGQLIDQATPIAVAHRNDAGHVPLHHHIAALRVDAQSAQLGLQLLEVARDPVRAVATAVGASWHHPQLARDGPFRLI